MKKAKQLVLSIVLVFILAVMVTGCGTKSLDEQVIGSWIKVSSSGGFFNQLNFYDDGTLDWGSDDYASWTIVNNNVLKFIYSSDIAWRYGSSETWEISISGDEMTLIDDDGAEGIYTRK